MGSGYDLSTKVPFRLMQGRLGDYNKEAKCSEIVGIKGVYQQYTRFQANGGNKQQERMIKDRRRSLDRAVLNSY